MTDTQIAIIVILLAGIVYWFIIHRKLQRKNQLLILICAYTLIIFLAWTTDNSWKLALLKTIVFGVLAAFTIDDLIKVSKKNRVVEQHDSTNSKQ